MSCRAALVLPALLSACGWVSPEDQVISMFFTASRQRDLTMLAGVATVIYDHRVEGSIQGFRVTGIDDGGSRTFTRPAADALALASLTPGGEPDVDLSALDVVIARKHVTIDADARTPGGSAGRREVVVTLERAIGRRDGAALEGRWLVTAYR